MDKKIILVDMDGVLANFEKGFLDSWKEKFPNLTHVPLTERKTFKVKDEYPEEIKKEVESIYVSPGFFRNLPIIEGSKNALIKMQELGHEVFICTKAISRFENCILEKYNWVNQNLGFEWTKRIIVAKDKTLIYGDYLIDDKPEATGLKTPAWKHVLFDAPYNKNVSNKLRITWDNWEKILNLKS